MIQVTGPWETESKSEHGAIPITWNLGPVAQRGTLPSADIEAKLQKWTVINYDHGNWSWLLDPNRHPVPPVLPRVPAPAKNQPVVDPARGRGSCGEWSLLRERGTQYNPHNLNFPKR